MNNIGNYGSIFAFFNEGGAVSCNNMFFFGFWGPPKGSLRFAGTPKGSLRFSGRIYPKIWYKKSLCSIFLPRFQGKPLF